MGSKPRSPSLMLLRRELAQARQLNPRNRLLEADLLERIGHEQWGRRRFSEAETALLEAVAIDEEQPTWKRSQRQQILAGILAAQGRLNDALGYYRRAHRFAREDGGPGDNMADFSRYFLAEHLLRMDRHGEALELLSEKPETSACEALTHMLRALALSALGRTSEATEEASKALSSAKSDGQRTRIADRLGSLGGG